MIQFNQISYSQFKSTHETFWFIIKSQMIAQQQFAGKKMFDLKKCNLTTISTTQKAIQMMSESETDQSQENHDNSSNPQPQPFVRQFIYPNLSNLQTLNRPGKKCHIKIMFDIENFTFVPKNFPKDILYMKYRDVLSHITIDQFYCKDRKSWQKLKNKFYLDVDIHSANFFVFGYGFFTNQRAGYQTIYLKIVSQIKAKPLASFGEHWYNFIGQKAQHKHPNRKYVEHIAVWKVKIGRAKDIVQVLNKDFKKVKIEPSKLRMWGFKNFNEK